MIVFLASVDRLEAIRRHIEILAVRSGPPRRHPLAFLVPGSKSVTTVAVLADEMVVEPL